MPPKIYLFVHVIKILLTQYDRIDTRGEFVTPGEGEECDRNEEEGMASNLFGERREAESSISRVKSSLFFSSDIVLSLYDLGMCGTKGCSDFL
jgi:hypothetical protein